MAAPAQLLGTVYTLLAPDSYATAPLLSTRMNLYSKLVPAGKLIVVVHSGFEAVYCAAESGGALAVFQLPSCAMEPAIFTVCPTTVVVLELNVTATVAAGVAQLVAVVVELGTVDEMLVVVGGVVPDAPVILMSAQVR